MQSRQETLVFNPYHAQQLQDIFTEPAASNRRMADFISELDSLGIIATRIISKERHRQTREIRVMIPSTELEHILQKDEFIEEIQQVKMKNQIKLMV